MTYQPTAHLTDAKGQIQVQKLSENWICLTKGHQKTHISSEIYANRNKKGSTVFPLHCCVVRCSFANASFSLHTLISPQAQEALSLLIIKAMRTGLHTEIWMTPKVSVDSGKGGAGKQTMPDGRNPKRSPMVRKECNTSETRLKSEISRCFSFFFSRRRQDEASITGEEEAAKRQRGNWVRKTNGWQRRSCPLLSPWGGQKFLFMKLMVWTSQLRVTGPRHKKAEWEEPQPDLDLSLNPLNMQRNGSFWTWKTTINYFRFIGDSHSVDSYRTSSQKNVPIRLKRGAADDRVTC